MEKVVQVAVESAENQKRENDELCYWKQRAEWDSPPDVWATSCGQLFVMLVDTPFENGMKFCCFCGRPLIQIELGGGADEDIGE